jgi:hypothetical protein
VNVRSELRWRCYEIEIDEDLMRPLRAHARRRKVTPSNLCLDILSERLAISE